MIQNQECLTSWEVVWFDEFPEELVGACHLVEVVRVGCEPKFEHATFLEWTSKISIYYHLHVGYRLLSRPSIVRYKWLNFFKYCFPI